MISRINDFASLMKPLSTLRQAFNFANDLRRLERVDEAKTLMRKTIPVVRRTLGENHDLTLSMRSMYAKMLCEDPTATLDGLRKAATTLEETEQIARRVLGSAHPLAKTIGNNIRTARAALQAATEK